MKRTGTEYPIIKIAFRGNSEMRSRPYLVQLLKLCKNTKFHDITTIGMGFTVRTIEKDWNRVPILKIAFRGNFEMGSRPNHVQLVKLCMNTKFHDNTTIGMGFTVRTIEKDWNRVTILKIAFRGNFEMGSRPYLVQHVKLCKNAKFHANTTIDMGFTVRTIEKDWNRVPHSKNSI